MIFIFPIFAYCIAVVVIVFLVNRVFKFKGKEIQSIKKVRKQIYLVSLIILPFLVLGYFSYLFGIAIDNHYNVKEGTFLWYATMDNETITEFPKIHVIGNVEYNSIGGDSQSIGVGWGIEYTSKANQQELVRFLIDYLRKDGYQIEKVNETQYYWTGRYKQNELNTLYSGFNKKGESLDLLIRNIGNGLYEVKCTIVY